ncbi:MAG: hypothetical protein A3H44_14670 [Gammaproteobacteria bacterium RIFCSPLOWO2_02_FULL_57_10]|nr:MAG: hypothetical protein A3H44_14670 [Gammaproteobacteria bacterium RIFCSPLOWO2_02_FULL_57_10]
MHIHWKSRQGRQRISNNDAAAIAISQVSTIAMVIDVAETGLNGQSLAKHWATTIVQKSFALPHPITAEQMIEIMRHEQRKLRHHYLHDVASYSIVCIDHESNHLDVLSTGDCLVGLGGKSETPRWISHPQNVGHQYYSMPSVSVDQRANGRHLLTNSLNARRFDMPYTTSLSLLPDVAVLLSSDGYWVEHLQSGSNFDELDDDASILTLTPGSRGVDSDTDCENLLILTPA